MDIMDFIPQFGQNLGGQAQTSSPMDDETAQLILKRKLAQADALRNAGLPQGQMVSGHYIRPSWTQYLASVLNKSRGEKEANAALEEYSGYIGGQRKKRQDAMTALAKALSPQAITEQGSYDIQVPNGQTPQTENLGGMQPYESGMKNISVPMTTTTGYRNPSSADVIGALSDYGNVTNNPAIAEKLLMTQAGQIMAPKQTEWKEVNGKLYGFDVHGNPTGKTLGEGKPVDYGTTANAVAQGLFGVDFSKLDQPRKLQVVNKMNEIKAAQLGISQGNLGIAQEKARYETAPVETTYPAPKSNMPKVGQEVDGHIYMGGNPNDQKSWRKK